jgi:hypothetical protein
MRYEDLVADPDSELRAAFGFLGLEDHGPGRTTAEGLNTDNFHADRTLRTGVNDRYFDDWYGPRRHTVVRRAYTAREAVQPIHDPIRPGRAPSVGDCARAHGPAPRPDSRG